MVADDPTNPIELKTFHCRIQNDHDAIAAEEAAYQEIPVARNVSASEIQSIYQRIKADIRELISSLTEVTES